jgi:flavin reductase (DIM6/NTAB) family NADH-FMN oxidoreductase RutF
MAKVTKKPGALLLPVPIALVSCAEPGKKPNIITIAYIGIVAYKPPLVQIGLRRERYSRGIILRSGEFVVNIPTEDHVEITDFCGTVSGHNVDKFKASGLTPSRGKKVKAPLIKECPVNMECKVSAAIELGTHTHIIGEIVALHMDKKVLDSRGRLSVKKMKPLAYCMGASEYYGMGRKLAEHSFTRGKLKKRQGKR